MLFFPCCIFYLYSLKITKLDLKPNYDFASPLVGLKPAVVHRDINSRNVLVNAEGNCVIGDFGFAMQVCGSSVVGEGDGDNSTITDVSLTL